ncbi:MBOAT family O-acyltransferase [Butyrivibrio sp. NC3005]|uniref:MBOAT family O-acyltransferase n=1 Tax=Butyrivibrio sp. NC3005 TaxID=1280685 RepID=UPI00047EFBA2|nr:MBOAT family O-acyltransferase [Butyrivibrio sp. NC3005]
MDYLSIEFMGVVLITLLLYYLLPIKQRWGVLLISSVFFYWNALNKNSILFFVHLIMVIYAYGMGILIDKVKLKKILLACIIVCLLPLLLKKYVSFGNSAFDNLVFPIGLSFYSLQMVSYMADISRQRIKPEKNFFKLYLYFTFFPIIIQGPISRYDQLSVELFNNHHFEYKRFIKAIYLVIWAFFLKYMIADKAGIFVDEVFGNYYTYRGLYVWVAGILFSIQLYTDFLACVALSIAVAEMFGIRLFRNFNYPYLSVSVKDFWQRWHRSLSLWLRDYVYIPLGGNRKGKIRKAINLIATFTISGMWHGDGFHYILWGWMHAFYQLGDVLGFDINSKTDKFFKLKKDTLTWRTWHRIITFFEVMLAWIVFRADSTLISLKMIKSMFLYFNPWIMFDDSLLKLGLDGKDWNVLLCSIGVLIGANAIRQKYDIREWLYDQNFVIRYVIITLLIIGIIIFGTYGVMYNAESFIYGNF